MDEEKKEEYFESFLVGLVGVLGIVAIIILGATVLEEEVGATEPGVLESLGVGIAVLLSTAFAAAVFVGGTILLGKVLRWTYFTGEKRAKNWLN